MDMKLNAALSVESKKRMWTKLAFGKRKKAREARNILLFFCT